MGLCSCRNIGIFWSCIILGVSYFLYTPVPDGFSEPWKLRTMLATLKAVGLLGAVSEKLGYDSSLNITRKFVQLSVASEIFSKNDPELEVKDTLFDGIPVRIYKPVNIKTPAAGLVFYHGGGWVMMSIDSYDIFTSLLAKKANIIVISVEYRLAPEHPFPIPFNDCVTATIHLLQNSEKYGIDPNRVAVGGDSAGGNIAAAIALKLRDTNQKPAIKNQILIYPVLQYCDWHLPAYSTAVVLFRRSEKGSFFRAYANLSKSFKPVLTKEEFISKEVRDKCKKMVDFNLIPESFVPQGYKQTDFYAPYSQSEDFVKAQMMLVNPYMFPMMSDNLRNLPDTVILSVEYDTLRDENIIFASRLKSAGNRVLWKHYKYGIHGCINLLDDISVGRELADDVVDYIRKHV